MGRVIPAVYAAPWMGKGDSVTSPAEALGRRHAIYDLAPRNPWRIAFNSSLLAVVDDKAIHNDVNGMVLAAAVGSISNPHVGSHGGVFSKFLGIYFT